MCREKLQTHYPEHISVERALQPYVAAICVTSFSEDPNEQDTGPEVHSVMLDDVDAEHIVDNLGQILGRTKMMKVRIAVGMWRDRASGEWRCYAEGWGADYANQRESTENTIIDNGLNEGQPLFWRYVEADVPVPMDEEVTVEGTIVDIDQKEDSR